MKANDVKYGRILVGLARFASAMLSPLLMPTYGVLIALWCSYLSAYDVGLRVTILLVVLGIYLILKDAEGFRRYMWFIMVTFTTAVVFCILVPNGQDLRPAVMAHHNAATWLVEYTYSIDTNTNVFPSVHILGCMAAVAAVWHTPGLRKPGWRWGVTLYAILIMAATVFVKQHAAIDVLAGLLTGAIAYVFVYVIVGRRRDRRLGRDC